MDAQVRKRRFDQLYDAHYDVVRRYAWRRAPSLADDVVAETFLVLWRRLDDAPDEALPWLIGVARNVLLNMSRGERRRGDHELRAEAVSDEVSFTESVSEFSALRCAFRVLPERDREILFLAAWEEFDRDTIARVLGCTRSNVALRLFRARKRLAAAMTDSPDGAVEGVPQRVGIDDE
jgi:RNA polymerase sigma factor (sigma-70 family)